MFLHRDHHMPAEYKSHPAFDKAYYLNLDFKIRNHSQDSQVQY